MTHNLVTCVMLLAMGFVACIVDVRTRRIPNALTLGAALGGMGAGDVKLLAALGAWLGPRETLWLAAYSGVAGGCWV